MMAIMDPLVTWTLYSIMYLHRSVAEPSKEMLALEVWYVHECTLKNKIWHWLQALKRVFWFIFNRDSDEPTETGGNKIKGLKGLGT